MKHGIYRLCSSVEEMTWHCGQLSRLAQLVERETVNLKVVGSNPPVRVHTCFTRDILFLEPYTAFHKHSLYV